MPGNPATVQVFNDLANKARSDPLTAAWLNQLYQNQMMNVLAAKAEHLASTGHHNVTEVARGVGQINYAGGVYSIVNGSSSIFQSVTKPATGECEITIDTSQLDGLTNVRDGSLRVGVLVSSILASGGTFMDIGANPTSTKIQVYQRQLAALGGNSWAAADGPFSIVLHNGPLTQTSSVQPPAFVPSKSTLQYDNGSATAWNDFITNQGQLWTNLLLEHNADGTHAIKEIAADICSVIATGGAPTIAYSTPGISGVTRVGVGHYTATLTGSAYNATPFNVFCNASYASGLGGAITDLNICWCPVNLQAPNPGASIDFYTYNYNAGAWALTDCDFQFVIHAPKSPGSTAYVKMQKAIQDAAVGFQSINQAIANEKALWASWTKEHYGIGKLGAMAYLGHHSTAQVPRVANAFEYESPLYGSASYSFAPRIATNIPTLGPAQRIADGIWFVPYLSRDGNSAHQVGIISQFKKGSSTVMGFAATRPATLAGTPGFYILTWQLSGGVWSLTDPIYSFSMNIYSA